MCEITQRNKKTIHNLSENDNGSGNYYPKG